MKQRTPISMHSRRRARRGISVLEVTAALVILAFAMTGLAHMLSLGAAHRRTSETRRLAQEEVANQAERIALLAWDETTAEKLQSLPISDELTTFVPSAKLSVALAEEAGPPVARRIEIGVAWTAADGVAEPIRLTVWKHQPAETRP
jgi:hypothetical protein